MKNVKLGFFAEDVPPKLIFAGKVVKFPEIYFRYAFAESVFRPEIRKTVANMEANFDEKIGSLKSFVEYGGDWVKDELDSLLTFTMDQLSLNGCYSISREDFFHKYILEELDDIPSIYDSMEKALDHINERQEEENARRVARRQANVAAGNNEWFELLRNGVGRGLDEVKNKTAANNIYNDTVQQKIKDEFIYICSSMTDLFAEALYDYAKVDLRNPVSEEDGNRAQVMFDNLTSDKIPESRVDEVALEIFEKNPITPGFLNWAVAKYGDPDGEMQKIADAFHVSIEDTKQELLENVFDNLDLSSEQSTLISKAALEKEEKRLQYSNDEYTAAIREKLVEFDLKARTVDGIEYDTREKAKKAAELKKAFRKIDFSSEKSTLDGKKMYSALEKKLGLTVCAYQEKIEEALKNFDLEARTVDGIEYDTREKAQKAAELKKAFDEIDFSSEEATLKGQKEYSALEEKLGLRVKKYHKKFDKTLKEMDLNARTFDGVEYDSRDKAQNAARLKETFDEIDFSSEESALAGQKKYLALEDEFGMRNTENRNKIEEALKNFDLEARTFEGVEYATREKASEIKRQTFALRDLLSSEKYGSAEQIQSVIDKIQQGNYTIDSAYTAKEKLAVRLEMIRHYPLGYVELIRLLLQPKFKVIITFSLLLLIGLLSIVPLLGEFAIVIYCLWLISLFFTTRSNFAKYMEIFIQQKKYKAAAFCYELSYQTMQDFLMLTQKNSEEGKE